MFQLFLNVSCISVNWLCFHFERVTERILPAVKERQLFIIQCLITWRSYGWLVALYGPLRPEKKWLPIRRQLFESILWNENVCILIKNSLKFLPWV